MSGVAVINHLTLDGVMQAPGRPDEDRRGGFEHGGWARAGNDEVMGRTMGERMTGGPLLLGRATYEALYAFWPHQTDNPYSEALNRVTKYVASRTASESLPWSNSVLMRDAAQGVARLKEQPGPDIVVLGSGDLIQTLLAHDLVDRWLLMTHPLVLGSGRRLFPDGAPFCRFRLADSLTTTTGVVISTYERA